MSEGKRECEVDMWLRKASAPASVKGGAAWVCRGGEGAEFPPLASCSYQKNEAADTDGQNEIPSSGGWADTWRYMWSFSYTAWC